MRYGIRYVLAAVLALTIAGAARAEHTGWRPDAKPELSDAEWLERLDARLAPVHGSLVDTLALVDGGSPAERDAYIVIIQEQAAKGIRILDELEPARACARDYVALERVMLLMWGDAADSYRQAQAGSSQAAGEVQALVPAAGYILREYADRVRLSTVCGTPEPAPTPEPTGAARTPTPMATP